MVDNIPGREWPKEMIGLLVEENIKRNNKQRLDVKRIETFYDELVKKGREINQESKDQFYISDGRTLQNRLEKYKENYLLWTLNDEAPFTNNVSERSLRSSKTKMKVSGQFDNLKRAQDFANIKSYLETGKRFGFNPTELIVKALSDDYITVQQMKEHDAQSA